MGTQARNRLLLILILWIALFLRTAGLATTPGLSGDESFNGADALRVLEGHPDVYFTTNFGREPLFIHSVALAMALLGRSSFAIRLTAVAYAIVGLALAYALARRHWGERVALLAAGLMAVSFWPVFTGRIGLRAITLPTLETATLLALSRGLGSRGGQNRGGQGRGGQDRRAPAHSRAWLLAAGACLGLTLYTYTSARVFPAVPVAWVALSALLGRPPVRARLRAVRGSLLLSLLVAFVVFAPLGAFFVREPQAANQRIEELSWTLDAVRSGDLQPLVRNIQLLARMFATEGDSDVYYNIPLRPIFAGPLGPPLGVLFLAGIALCLVRPRRPGSLLVLTWLGVMLLPTLLSTGNAILRSVGALVPIFLLPALALDAAVGWAAAALRRATAPRAPRVPAWLRSLTAILVAAVAVASIAADTAHAYFGVWTRLPRVRQVYGTGLASLGQALTALNPSPEATAVMVGCEYAADLCRDQVQLQTRYAGPIGWFRNREALVIPATRPAQRAVLYFVAGSFPEAPALQHALGAADLVQRFTGPDGTVEAEIWRLPVDRVAAAIAPATPAGGRFRDTMQVLGTTLPEAVARGETLGIGLIWRAPESFDRDAADPPRWSATLGNGAGDIWSESGDILPYAIWDWAPGDVVIQTIALPVPAEVPQGDWVPEITLYRQHGGTLVYIDAAGDPRRSLRLDPVNVTGAPTVPLAPGLTPLGAGQELGLVEIETSAEVAAGGELLTTARWQAIAAPVQDYALALSVVPGACSAQTGDSTPEDATAAAPILTDRQPLVTGYPTTAWTAGEQVRAFTRTPVDPALPNGEYALTIALAWVLPNGTQATQPVLCQPLRIAGRPHIYDLPAVQTASDVAFEGGIRLLGYDLGLPEGGLRAGDAFELTLSWQTAAPLARDLTVFVHVYADAARSAIVAQHDGAPCAGTCPTTGWLPEEVLRDGRSVQIPAGAAPGTYPLGIGLYDAQTFERLSLVGSTDNVLILTDITVR